MFALVLSWDLGIVVVPCVWLKPRPSLPFRVIFQPKVCGLSAMGNAASSSCASPRDEALRTSKDVFPEKRPRRVLLRKALSSKTVF